MNSKRECAEYFKRQNGYHRCFLAMRKKWETYGRVSGRIFLADATEEEKRALSGILGKVFYGDEIRFTMREFQEALQKTRFSSVGLCELLEEYFGEKLSTNQERKLSKRKEQEQFFRKIQEIFLQTGEVTLVSDWFQSMSESHEYGYTLLMSEFKKAPHLAEILAKNVGAALGEVIRSREEVPLAVFAAKCTKNPHYFDRGTAAGTLLVHGICFLEKCQFPKNAYDWRALLLKEGIVPDMISNMVTGYGIHLQTGEGLHPAYESFCQMQQPGVITMENLKGVVGAYSRNGVVCIVENEMVFSYLLEMARPAQAAFLCTSGQLRAAAQEVIELLVQSGTSIHYSGDMDPDGLLIADKLWKRYPDYIHIWRMSAADYINSISGEKITKQQVSKLEQIENPILQQTTAKMKELGRASYQENLKDALVNDIRGMEEDNGWITKFK